MIIGGSSGTAMWAAMQVAKQLKPGQKCVVLLADSVRNYMSKFLNDDWMKNNGFLAGDSSKKAAETMASSSTAGANGSKSPKRSPSPDSKLKEQQQQPIFNFGNHAIRDLQLPKAVTVTTETTCADAAKLMQQHNFDQVPVVAAGGSGSALAGLVTLGNILAKVARGLAAMTDPVSDVMFRFNTKKNFKEVTLDTPLKDLTAFFDTHSAAVVTEAKKDAKKDKQTAAPIHVVTKFDLVSFMVRQAGSATKSKKPKTAQ